MDCYERDRGKLGTTLEHRHLTMSYILDALKKSEAERSRGTVPPLLVPSQTPLRSSLVVWVALGVLVVNACLVAAWMFWPRIPIPANSTAPPIAAAAPGAVTAAPRRVEQSRVIAPLQATVIAPESAPVKPDRALTQSVATQIQPQPGMSAQDGEPDEQSLAQRFPFSTHVYADDPSMRAVTMNGKRFVEGDTISPGVTLKEITESGVVLDINGRTVQLDVLQDWR